MQCLHDDEVGILKLELHQLIKQIDQITVESRSHIEQLRLVRKQLAYMESKCDEFNQQPIKMGLEWDKDLDFKGGQ